MTGLTGVQVVDELTVVYTSAARTGVPANVNVVELPMCSSGSAAADPLVSAPPRWEGPFVIQKRDIDNETVVSATKTIGVTDSKR